MRTFSYLLALSLAAVARAGGSIDNTAEAARIAAAASQLDGAGEYVFTNVKTGHVLGFSRNSGTTDFFPLDGGDSVSVQFSNDGSARISGGNNKCASAQWSYEVEGGVDYAAVSYACAVGSGLLTGTTTLEKTKQWWYLLPAGSSDSGSSSNDDDEADDDEDEDEDEDEDSGISIDIGVSFAAKGSKNRVAAAKVAAASPAAAESTPSPAAAEPAPSASSDSAASSSSPPKSPSTKSSSRSSRSKQAQYNKLGYWTGAEPVSRKGVDVSGVDKHDKTTWFCKHTGKWLARHPNYVTSGHPECASDLKAYLAANPSRMMVKRGRPSHHDMAAKLAKKGQTTYHIIAVDHLDDMATRAIAHESLDTAGGYTSTKLNLWDQNDDGQLWTITKV
ncbi:hypothetical protein JCM11251_005310 [Rhodosporidiobolus azoricus]